MFVVLVTGADVDGRLEAIRELPEQCCGEVSEGMKASEVYQQDYAEADKPLLVDLLPW